GDGIDVTDNASNTTIGGTTDTKGNVISGNAGHGVQIDLHTIGTLLQGNTIGLDQGWSAAVANGLNGVDVMGGGVTVGGNWMTSARNVIGGNAGDGMRVDGAGANSTRIQGNYIGATPSAILPNRGDGVRVVDASDVTIGGPAEGAGNLISGNGQFGI